VKIAIVGAGPAGCHLAHLLADTEHEILLFDHRAPYEKPCGGGLSPLVGRRFPDVMDLPFQRHRPPCVALRSSAGSQVDQELDSSNWAIVSRAEFGRALLERALANDRVLHIRQRVTGVEQIGEGWSVRTAAGKTFCTEFLVGADGVRSIVRREVVGPIARRHLAMAVGYRVRGAPDAIVFQTYADLEGYLWSFPRVDHASVGIATRLGDVPVHDLWQRVSGFLAETCPEIKKEQRWAGLLPMAQDASLWDTPCAGPGWALLGDAAGLVHPITGEGIAYALWSAELLAEAFRQGDPGSYQSLWREAYGAGLAAASIMLSSTGSDEGAYEIVFQLAMMIAFSGLGR
jgi:flavin-dependent dehydrogenase